MFHAKQICKFDQWIALLIRPIEIDPGHKLLKLNTVQWKLSLLQSGPRGFFFVLDLQLRILCERATRSNCVCPLPWFFPILWQRSVSFASPLTLRFWAKKMSLIFHWFPLRCEKFSQFLLESSDVCWSPFDLCVFSPGINMRRKFDCCQCKLKHRLQLRFC